MSGLSQNIVYRMMGANFTEDEFTAIVNAALRRFSDDDANARKEVLSKMACSWLVALGLTMDEIAALLVQTKLERAA